VIGDCRTDLLKLLSSGLTGSAGTHLDHVFDVLHFPANVLRLLHSSKR
jgi:hypothetical protein